MATAGEETLISGMPPPYGYSPLPENHIRLLQLLPSRDETSTIECKLVNYHLLVPRRGAHLYEAVSYVWGNPPNTHSIVADGAHLSIRQNCHAMLARLRDPALPRFLWVDAVCINQDDNDEKTDQVQLMTWIYASARGVIVWLEEPVGTEARADDEGRGEIAPALQLVRLAAAEGPGQVLDLEASRDKIDRLSRCSWFRRIWVLQEVAAARRVEIICHDEELDGEVFCAGLQALKFADHRSGTLGPVNTAVFLIKDPILRHKRGSGAMKSFSLNVMPLLELIRKYHDRNATDRRDKVFALLGMSSEIPKGLATDYNTPWSRVFHRLVESIVGSGAEITTEERHEIAVIRTRFRVLGVVSKVSQKSALDSVEEVNIRLAAARAKQVSSTARTPAHVPPYSFGNGSRVAPATITWLIHTPVLSIREGDIVCHIRDTTQPTILRPQHHHMRCLVIAITTTPIQTPQSGRPSYKLPQGHSEVLEDVPLVWDWSISNRSYEISDAGVDTERASVHSGLVNVNVALPKPLGDMALEIRNWSRLAFQTGRGDVAVQTIELFLSKAVEMDEDRNFHLLAAIDMFRDLYIEVGADFSKHHNRQALCWMADKLRKQGSHYTEVTPLMLFDAILYQSDGDLTGFEKISVLARYRSSDISITTEVLKAAVRCFDRKITSWAFEQLRLQQHPVDVDIAEVMNWALANVDYKVVAELVAYFRESALVVSIEAAKMLWHPKTKEFWPSCSADWAKVSWMPSSTGPLFDTWRARIPIQTKQKFLEDMAWHNSTIETMEFYLSEWGDEDQVVTSITMAGVVQRYHQGAEATLRRLIDRYGDRLPITEEVVVSAMKNQHKSLAMVRMLCEHYGDLLPITKKMVDAASKTRGAVDLEVAKFVQERFGKGV
ncbi:heterokaryon incompatibility protein-domain-containing protein [Cercophora newfieldiana]|uniref:Heterokaryon incompatibility protein-domain-containing protein n=1 Tax=Cercophora newfieldiana TaxID=92897 RepID=A0AA39YLR2_9PEZI|nr:heterokaryon incompatibility protein-domain-containing protein [Cercophora newfieldiana]